MTKNAADPSEILSNYRATTGCHKQDDSIALLWKYCIVNFFFTTGYGLDGPGPNPDGGEIFRTCPDRPWGLPRVFPGGRKRPGRDADPSLPSSAEV
jgi:hypothetical protein